MSLTDDIKAAIIEAIEARDVQGGIVTVDFLQSELVEHHKQLEAMMQKLLRSEASTQQQDPLAVSACNQLHTGQDGENGILNPSHSVVVGFGRCRKTGNSPQRYSGRLDGAFGSMADL